MRGAVFFDVDGTLVPDTSSSQHLAASVGHLTDLAEAEEAYAQGRRSHGRTGCATASAAG